MLRSHNGLHSKQGHQELEAYLATVLYLESKLCLCPPHTKTHNGLHAGKYGLAILTMQDLLSPEDFMILEMDSLVLHP